MIKPKHSLLHKLFFSNYFRFILKKDFNKIIINNEIREKNLPVLLIGNHFSWWDGFIAYELNRRIFKRQFYIMMLEEQLNKYPFFKRLGAFSIAPGRRSVLTSINYARELTVNNNNILILFPQGKIESQHSEKLSFKSGWFRILRNRKQPLQIVFMTSFTDYSSFRKPSLYIYLKEPGETDKISLNDLENSYNNFYMETKKKQAITE